MTKRELVIAVSEETGHVQDEIAVIVQKTLNHIAAAVARGEKVELRNFGVFELRIQKARVGRDPHAPTKLFPIPARTVVKFKAGQELRDAVLKLGPKGKSAPGKKLS
jgi:nucleoid DNA-binding protein